MKLDKAQQSVLKLINEQSSVFVTGGAGCGKSETLKACCEFLKENGLDYEVVAPTGVAACLVGGTTIHSLFCLGIADERPQKIIDKCSTFKKVIQRISQLDVIVIDEISMVSCSLFYIMDHICRRIRHYPSIPFGGIRLVIFGDFLQLPPVIPDDLPHVEYQLQCAAPGITTPCFAFDSSSWEELDPMVVVLTHNHRLGSDTPEEKAWCELVSRVRHGQCTEADIAEINKRSSENSDRTSSPYFQPTRLYFRRADVAKENDAKLAAIPGDARVAIREFYTKEIVRKNKKPSLKHHPLDPRMVEDKKKFVDANSQAPPRLELKIGALVMCVFNVDVPGGICNGTRGVVREFITFSDVSHGRVAVPNGAAMFRTLENRACNGVFGVVVEFEDVRPGKRGTTFTRPIFPVEWEHKIDKHNALVQIQLPFQLAWSTTIHKSQGSTLGEVEVFARGMNSPGALYVALTRCTREGLRIGDSIDLRSVSVHPRALQYMNLVYESKR